MGWRGCGRRFGRDVGGATAVEMALVGMPFIALVIAAVQIALILLSQSALEVATEKSARTVLTGVAQGKNLTQAQFATQVCNNLPSILSNCANLMVDAQVYGSFSSANTSAPTLTYDQQGSVNNNWQYNLGTSGQYVVLRVMYLLPVVGGPLNFIPGTAHGKRLLMATAVMQNEPY